MLLQRQTLIDYHQLVPLHCGFVVAVPHLLEAILLVAFSGASWLDCQHLHLWQAVLHSKFSILASCLGLAAMPGINDMVGRAGVDDTPVALALHTGTTAAAGLHG